MAGKQLDYPVPDDCPLRLCCRICNQIKPRDEFHRRKNTPTTFDYICKGCNVDVTRMARLRKELREAGIEAFKNDTDELANLVKLRRRIMFDHQKGNSNDS